MHRVLAFDVNETLLDLGALRDPFAHAFGDASPLGELFARLLHGSSVATLTDAYEDFASIGRKALEVVASRRGVRLSTGDRDAILGAMLELPAHREVPGALWRLRSAGFPLATLTNSPPEMARAQLENAGILDLFDEVLFVQGLRRYKPAPEPYRAWRWSDWMCTRRTSGWWSLTTGTCGVRCGRAVPPPTWRGRAPRL